MYLRPMSLEFAKWDGTGNDFILVDGRQAGRLPSEWSDEEVRAICHRHHGVGADGVVVVSPGGDVDLTVDFRNPDGSRSFCGNGTRSALAWAMQEGLVGDSCSIQAVDGLHHGRLSSQGKPGISLAVSSAPESIDPMHSESLRAAFLNTGSPHHMEWLADELQLTELDLGPAARPIRHDLRYAPGGTNVNFLAPSSTPGTLHIRTFERGVEGETLSCGTGVVASALADMAVSGLHSGIHQRVVQARGGRLEVQAEAKGGGMFDNVWLFGQAVEVFRGTWNRMAMGLFMVLGLTDMAQASEWSESLSDDVQVSVLTASPGRELYASFGHTAFRVEDRSTGTDVVFNYGTFRVDEGFYWRFIQGDMIYRLGTSTYGRFQLSYLREGRALHEQSLRLTPADARTMVSFLEINARPENANYAYSFFRDNCSTKVIDVLSKCFGERFDAGCDEDSLTYHEALRPYTSGLPWASWGIELILGFQAEQTMPPCGHAFLPDQMSEQLTLMTLDGLPLVNPVEEVFPVEGPWYAGWPGGHVRRQGPAMLAWGWALMLCLLSVLSRIRPRTWTHRLRRLVSGIAGLSGSVLALFLAFMQLFTAHTDTWWNADFVWASLGIPALLGAVRGDRVLDQVGWRTRILLAWTAGSWILLWWSGAMAIPATCGMATTMSLAAWSSRLTSSR